MNSIVTAAEATAYERIHHYLALCKLKVVALILFTAFVGMLLSSQGWVPMQPMLLGLVGIGLAAAAGAALNHVVDRHIDAMMERTSARPLPQENITQANAIAFALSLAVASMLILGLWVNLLTMGLTFGALIGYAVIYTVFLKRNTPQNIVWGGAAGAAPPLLGWVAITGQISQQALLLFLIVFLWTPPHFWALAIRRRAEYAKVGVPMLPVTHGIEYTKVQILLYTVMLMIVSLMPFLVHMSGLIYLLGALLLGSVFIYHALRLLRSEGDKHAMKTFGFSIFYLSFLFGFLLLDHYARIIARLLI